MRIDKFLEKISQDERVDKIEYDKRTGYKLILKKGYGVLNKSYRSQWVENNYFDYQEIYIKDWARESSQSEIEWFLSKVVAYNEQELVLENKKSKLEALNKFLTSTVKEISRIEYEIKAANERKQIFEKRREKLTELAKGIEKEVEACGTTEQL